MNTHDLDARSTILPVILAGGRGERLWPTSRIDYPKQFTKLTGDSSLFQQCIKRVENSVECNFKNPLIVTNEDYRFLVSSQLDEISSQPSSVLIEPSSKNTAPAILASALFAIEQDQDSLLLVCPSDHLIENESEFHKALTHGVKLAKEGNLLTFGIKPSYPETGYGYLELGNAIDSLASKVIKFVEKPEIDLAAKMFESGNFLWNSGIFLFKASDIISAFKKYSKDLIEPLSNSISRAQSDSCYVFLDEDNWKACESISIDYAVMEKAQNVLTIPLRLGWTDLGDWNAVWRLESKNSDGVVLSSNAYEIDSKNTLLRTENDQMIVGIGLKDIVAVATKDAVLVANKNNTQKVKEIVNQFKEKNLKEVKEFPKTIKPWGWYESLLNTGSYQVKLICVKPGESLSLQSHKMRSENWIVVEGTATVTLNDTIQDLHQDESIYIPTGSIHRLQNRQETILYVVEVQIGSYLGEDDIKRYEDVYDRVR